jgi:hypothetical protein
MNHEIITYGYFEKVLDEWSDISYINIADNNMFYSKYYLSSYLNVNTK